MSSGNSYALSMVLHQMEFLNHMLHRAKIVKMCSFIKQMMNIIFQEHCLSILSQVLSTISKMVLMPICITLRTFSSLKKEVAPVTIGQLVSDKRFDDQAKF